jgi:primosomal protein N'
MSVCYKFIDCPQCDFDQAHFHKNSRHSEDTMCTRCGYEEKWNLICDSAGERNRLAQGDEERATSTKLFTNTFGL